MRYLPKPVPVEAFMLEQGRYVVVPDGGEPRLVDADAFEAAYEPEGLREKYGPGITSPSLPGVPAAPSDLVPAAERMQQAIAARTEPGGPGGRVLAEGSAAAEAAIEETRARLSPGRGRKACQQCGHIDNAASKRCGECDAIYRKKK